MAKDREDTDEQMHRDADRWNRGRTGGNRKGVGAYTEVTRYKSGDDIGADRPSKIDRSDSPSKPSYGSGHYPSTKDG
jgi:hypothetical protein